jgi:osmotically-inducible protein OsmY
VKGVHDDDLRIEWWARDRMRRQSQGKLPDEAEIRDAIRDAFRRDPRVVSFRPVIAVEGGVVTLSGVVGSLGASRAAEQDARNTLGVWRVKNHLRVRPDPQRSDAELRQDVAAALIRDPYVNRFALTAAVRNARVYLHGSVFSPFQRDRAGYVAAGVKGVVEVSNEVDVRRAWAWKSDWEIREDVREQLFWSPLVEGEGVRIRVTDGIVTLEGEVTTWGERNEAVENAYQGGARRVIDRLDVEYGPPLYPGGFVPPHGPLWPYRVG